jgi:hypothetical protein
MGKGARTVSTWVLRPHLEGGYAYFDGEGWGSGDGACDVNGPYFDVGDGSGGGSRYGYRFSLGDGNGRGEGVVSRSEEGQGRET